MDALLLGIATAAVSLGLFGAAYCAALLATRPARPRPAPATPDLGEEPPAVVNLLGNRWRLDEDAVEATLLDLAARRVIELRQPADDPRHTTIHLREDPSGELAQLRPYERRVLDRVRGLAVDGVIPLTALTFRNEHQARAWTRRLHREVVADARDRGLSRRRLSSGLVAAMVAVAALTAGGLFLASGVLVRDITGSGDLRGPIGLAVIAFLVLSGVVTRRRDEQRDTPAGREAAARWLGVREWLRAHEEFADLPPAAVAVWDQYLPYGAALGVTHTASAVLDLGMGNRKLVWSSHGGSWRRVRVRYPRFWSRYGRSVPSLLFPALLSLLVGGLLVRYHRVPADLAELDDLLATRWRDLAVQVGLVLGWLLLLRGGYRAVRALVDLATTRTITGEVLWLEVWRTRSQGSQRARRRVPWLQYLAVDDGSADRTTAWGLPQNLPPPRCRDGDIVTIRVRPWSRRVAQLTVVERGKAYHLTDAPAPGETAARPPRGATTAVAADGLLTAEEVGQALGMPVRPPETAPMPGPMATTTFRTADRGRPVLLVQVARGTMGGWAWRANRRGTELPGIGDGAHHAGDRAVLRAGDTTLLLTLMRDAKGRHDHLPWLLQQAAARLSEPAAAAVPPTPAPDPATPAT